MKKGINYFSLTGNTAEEKFKQAKKCGFEGVELVLVGEGELSFASSKDELLRAKECANNMGLEFYSVMSGLCWTYTATSDNADDRAKAYEYTVKQLETAALLGCQTILYVPGAVAADFTNLPVVDYETAYDRALEALKKLAPVAEELKVEIGVENVWNKFLQSPLEMRDFIDKADNKYVGSYFDVGNVLVNGYPEHWIKALGSRIKKVHLKDFKRAIGNLDGFTDLLAGDVDYIAVAKAFEKIGYNGWVTAEMGTYPINNEVMLRHTKDAMDQIFG